jgi:putative ABC transport system permease protein
VDKRADSIDFLVAKSGTSIETLRDRILAITDPYYVIKVSTREEFKGEAASNIDGLLNLIYGLLGLAIVIAILGIINTLALSVVERRQEIGMLRAIGMIRGQLRRAIYVESALIALFGALIGVAIGLSMGWAVIHLLGKDAPLNAVIPWARTGWFLLIAVVVGVLAALWPAFRAARMKPLDAIAE